MIQVSIVDSNAGLETLREEWDHLVGLNLNTTVFSTWEWAAAWWRSYGAGKNLRILKILNDGRLIGLGPFFFDDVRRFGTLSYRALRLIGDGSGDSDYLGTICAPGEEDSVARSIVNHLLSHRSIWDIILLSEVPETSLSLRFLRRYFQESDCYWNEAQTCCCQVVLPLTWDDYLLGLRPRMRTKIRSLTRQLEKDFKVRFSVCQDASELDAGLKSLFRLHAKRWRTKGQTGVFVSTAKRRFYNEISPASLSRGWLRFYTLAIDDWAVAHQYCFEFQNKMFLLQEGFDPEWDQHGVGNVLRAYVFRDCIERKISVYDFLGGITSHKLSWGAVPKTSVNAVALAPRIKSRLFLYIPKAISTAKNGLRGVVPERVIVWRESWKKRNASLRVNDAEADS